MFFSYSDSNKILHYNFHVCLGLFLNMIDSKMFHKTKYLILKNQ